MPKTYLNRRQWLRSIKSSADQSSIHTYVREEGWTSTSKGKTTKHDHLEGEVVFRDCSRNTHISLYASSKRQAERQLQVIDKVIKELELFRAKYIEAMEDIWPTSGK